MGIFQQGDALIVVDMQNDFAHPDGSLYVQGAEKLVGAIGELVDFAYEADIPVIFTMDWHPKETPHFDKWPVHCVQDTWGSDMVSDLDSPDGDPDGDYTVLKGQGQTDGYSGFETGYLDQILRDNGVRKAFIVGVAYDFCVKETALDSVRLGYETRVFKNLTKSVNPDNDVKVEDELNAAGVSVFDFQNSVW